jgi:hypothetical protein
LSRINTSSCSAVDYLYYRLTRAADSPISHAATARRR